jgi:hypothetical protein
VPSLALLPVKLWLMFASHDGIFVLSALEPGERTRT